MGKLTRAFLGFRMQNCQGISVPLKCDFFQINKHIIGRFFFFLQFMFFRYTRCILGFFIYLIVLGEQQVHGQKHALNFWSHALTGPLSSKDNLVDYFLACSMVANRTVLTYFQYMYAILLAILKYLYLNKFCLFSCSMLMDSFRDLQWQLLD